MFLVSHSETQKGPPVAPVFPLSEEAVAEVTRSSHELTDLELDLISGSHLNTLNINDPYRWLLELRGRPEIALDSDERDIQAYRAGVVTGKQIVGQTLILAAERSQIIPEPKLFDPIEGVELHPLRSKDPVHSITDSDAIDLLSRYTSARDLLPYLDTNGTVNHFDFLKYKWLGRKHEFLTKEAIAHGSDDYIFTGIMDAFTAYASIYNYEPSSPRSRARTLGGAVIGRLLRTSKSSIRRVFGIIQEEPESKEPLSQITDEFRVPDFNIEIKKD